jgi:hypothetical protein
MDDLFKAMMGAGAEGDGGAPGSDAGSEGDGGGSKASEKPDSSMDDLYKEMMGQ